MRVHSLHIYPVKAVHAIDLSESLMDLGGLAHDRRWMLVDTNGRFISQRECPKLAQVRARLTPEGLIVSAPQQKDILIGMPEQEASALSVTLWKRNMEACGAADAARRWFGAFLGIECRLVHQSAPESFADSSPVLVTTTASLKDLSHRMGADIPMNRFRPNIVIDHDEPWAEDRWKNIRIGGVKLEIVKPCTRCVVTTIDQETGEKTGAEPLATLKKFRMIRQPGLTGVVFGQYAAPCQSGTIKVGDKVDILSTQPIPCYLA